MRTHRCFLICHTLFGRRIERRDNDHSVLGEANIDVGELGVDLAAHLLESSRISYDDRFSARQNETLFPPF